MNVSPAIRGLVLLSAICGTATSGHAEERICFCASPDSSPCRQACDTPPKQTVKTISVGGSSFPVIGYRSQVPAFPTTATEARAAKKSLEDPEVRDQLMKVLDERATIAGETRKAILEVPTEKATAEEKQSAKIGFEADARRYEKWSAEIGAAQARQKVKESLK